MNSIAKNLHDIHTRMQCAAAKAARTPESVSLVAVSKFHGIASVEEALNAGQRVFGENRVQEAEEKFGGLKASHPDIELHLIGPLQTNKAIDAVRLFDVIQTLDRPKLAEALVAAMQKVDRRPQLYIEINQGQEPQKAGIAPADLATFLQRCRAEWHLKIEGLMSIPPQESAPESYFRSLKALADQHDLPSVSMGMSNDFEAAIACGATHIRIGTAVFGSRPPVAG